MIKEVWRNGKWNTVSGSFAEVKEILSSSYGTEWKTAAGNENDHGTFGGYYEGASFNHTAQGYTGDPTGSRWNSD